ncbi:hypothetical protein AAS80_003036 [Escherichia coli]|uniref:hypothetical protein n=1 Tax=Escherichia coli TaxID=562 RepID=UPI000DFA1C2A|nr:hypothetical protein [Escherichia coli]EFL6449063.1 hypothetical protein [Escherichia coli]STK94809.1 phage-like protein [Escherichia coli]
MSEVTDLVVIEKQNAMAVFTNKEQLDPLIEKIEKEARSLVPDVSTKKGRDAIASMAHKVARSKTYIDNAGKNLVAELKALPKQIDESRRIVRERLDALKDEVRKPLTDWENAESARKESLQQRLADLRSLADVIDAVGIYLPSVEIQKRIESAKSVSLDESWEECAAEAGAAKDATIQKLEAAFIVARQREEETAELERLRVEAEEKSRRDREEKIRREAAEKATRDAEEKAKRERQQHQDALSEISGIQQQVIIAQSGRLGVRQGGTIQCIKDTLAETEAWPIDERFGSLVGAAENAKHQAITQIKQLLINAETIQKQQEESDRIKREAEAKEAARQAEEKRIADETAKREADVKHRKVVGTEIVNALLANTTITRDQAIEVLTALKDGLVPRTKIHY